MIVVSNSSPLIGLAAINLLTLLRSLYTIIHIPEAVYHEVAVEGAGRPGAKGVAAATYIHRHTVTNRRAVNKLMVTAKLEAGESEAIVLALSLKATQIILDERAARRYAKARHLPVIGTLGILLQAKRKGLIPSVQQPMDKLIKFGLHIHPTVYQTILRSADEA